MWKQMLTGCSLVVFVMACQTANEPSLQVQFCLTKEANADELRRTLRQIAREHNMEFFDRSAETEAELRFLGDLPPEVQRSFPIINVSVKAKDGLGIAGGNPGLPANEVALAFISSTDKVKTQNFVRKVLIKLRQKWDVVRVPAGRGASSLGDCSPEGE